MWLNCTYDSAKQPKCHKDGRLSAWSVLRWVLCSRRHVIRPLRCWRVVGVKLLLRHWVAWRGLVVPAGGSVVAMGLGGAVVGSRGRGCWLLAPGCSVGEGEGGITYCTSADMSTLRR